MNNASLGWVVEVLLNFANVLLNSESAYWTYSSTLTAVDTFGFSDWLEECWSYNSVLTTTSEVDSCNTVNFLTISYTLTAEDTFFWISDDLAPDPLCAQVCGVTFISCF